MQEKPAEASFFYHKIIYYIFFSFPIPWFRYRGSSFHPFVPPSFFIFYFSFLSLLLPNFSSAPSIDVTRRGEGEGVEIECVGDTVEFYLPFFLSFLPSFLPSFFCVGIAGACDIDRAEILFIYYILFSLTLSCLPTLPTLPACRYPPVRALYIISFHIIS